MIKNCIIQFHYLMKVRVRPSLEACYDIWDIDSLPPDVSGSDVVPPLCYSFTNVATKPGSIWTSQFPIFKYNNESKYRN